MCFFNTPFNVCSATITIICFGIIRSQTGFLFECWFFVVVAVSFGVDFCFANYLFIYFTNSPPVSPPITHTHMHTTTLLNPEV